MKSSLILISISILTVGGGCQATKDLEVCQTENARLSKDLEACQAENTQLTENANKAIAIATQAREEQLSQVKILAEAGLELEQRVFDVMAKLEQAQAELAKCEKLRVESANHEAEIETAKQSAVKAQLQVLKLKAEIAELKAQIAEMQVGAATQ